MAATTVEVLDKRFAPSDIEGIKSQLTTYGFAVVHGVLSAAECTKGIDGFWEWMGRWGVERDDRQTWRNGPEGSWPPTMHGGMIQWFSVGQEQFVWDIRANPAVHQVFAGIWGTPDLVASFDGVCMMRPPRQLKHPAHIPEAEAKSFVSKSAKKTGWWLHTDQHPSRPGFVSGFNCIQGLVTLEEMSHADATLVVVPGSHKYHAEFFADKPKFKGDWYKLSVNERDFLLKEKGFRPHRVSAGAGDLVLWDSRAFHQGTSALSTRPHPERFRYVVYVCQLPASRLRKGETEKRRKAFEEGRMTSHWAADGVKIFPKAPRTYGAETVEPPAWRRPVLSSLGQQLASMASSSVSSSSSSATVASSSSSSSLKAEEKSFDMPCDVDAAAVVTPTKRSRATKEKGEDEEFDTNRVVAKKEKKKAKRTDA